MPITSSAKKALRAGDRKKVFNLRRKNDLNKTVKEIRTLVAAKKVKEAEALLPKAYSTIDKSAKIGLIKKNASSRKKSRLAALIKKNK
ncbi:MAG: 30S ribosomal protein S20 [bacterium]